MKETLPITIIPLEEKSGTFEGQAYKGVLCRYNGKVLRIKADPSLDFKPYIDKETEIELDLRSGMNLAATVRIVAIND